MTTQEEKVVGLFEHNAPDAIETYTGRAFPILEPVAELVVIEDVAHALSNICRFGGHTRRFYSVGEHCCHVSDLVSGWGYSEQAALLALLHDAAEAYVGDCVRPIKTMDAMAGYRALEAAIQAMIDRRVLGASDVYATTVARVIKRADNQMVRAEAEQLMPSRGEKWAWGGTPAASGEVHCWPPEITKAEFLKRYERLK